MSPETPPQYIPVGYLLIAIGALVSAIGILFWQLQAARTQCLDLAREVLPVVANLMKLVERLERKDGET